jgi:hypothetical protein
MERLLLSLLLFPDWTGPNTVINETLYILMKYNVEETSFNVHTKKYRLMSTQTT